MSITLIAAICIFYSTIGGIKAVLVTDIFQAILMFSSLICIMAVAAGEIDGGLANVLSIASRGNRTDIFDFRLDPTVRQSWWSLLSAGFCIFCSLYGVNQVEVQRLMTVESLKSARLALFLNLPLLVSFGLITSFCGLTFYAVYKDCDPVKNGEIALPDRIMPHFVATKMKVYPGLTGLFISGIFSASLSTISAMLNSLAAVFIEDYLKRLFRKLGKTFPADKSVVFGKILAVMLGLACMMVAFIAGSLGSLVQLVVSITGAICGPVLGIFTLGMFFERANERGAIVGIVTALCTCMWASFGQPRPPFQPLPVYTHGCNSTLSSHDDITIIDKQVATAAAVENEEASFFYLYRISYWWYSSMGTAITILVGYAASVIFEKLSSSSSTASAPIEPDPSLFTPIVARRIRKRRADASRTTGSQVFTLEEHEREEAEMTRRRATPPPPTPSRRRPRQ